MKKAVIEILYDGEVVLGSRAAGKLNSNIAFIMLRKKYICPS